MRRIVLKDALDASLWKIVQSGSLFVTPEHLLLAFLDDGELRIFLASLKIDPTALTEMVEECVRGADSYKRKQLQPFFSFAFSRIKARLEEKGLDWRDARSVYACHFLEAYAYDNSIEGYISPSMPGLMLGQRHREIELAVYRQLPQS